MSRKYREQLEDAISSMTRRLLRPVVIAYKDKNSIIEFFNSQENEPQSLEKHLVFVGVVGISDSRSQEEYRLILDLEQRGTKFIIASSKKTGHSEKLFQEMGLSSNSESLTLKGS